MNKKGKKNLSKIKVTLITCSVIVSASLVGLMIYKVVDKKNKFKEDHPGETGFLKNEIGHISTEQYNIGYAEYELTTESDSDDKTAADEKASDDTGKITEEKTEDHNNDAEIKIDKNKEIIPRTKKCITAYNGNNDEIKWIENYDSNGVKTDIKDDEGAILTKYEYDSNGNCIRESYYSDGKDQGYTEYLYDSRGNCTWSFATRNGVNGVEKSYEYDDAGNMIRSTTTMNGDTTIQENEYDKNGNLIRWTGIGASGDKEYIIWEYDSKGFKTGGTLYDDEGMDSIYQIETDNRGNITRQARVMDGEVLNSEGCEYDEFGNATRKYKNDNLIEENQYDERGNRLKHIVYDDGNVKQYWIYEYWD
ncbi:MAG: hypothetical protein K6C35_03530 [Eubacterium sp.]|nr:hypothetical protein [Eubacterium sp.]